MTRPAAETANVVLKRRAAAWYWHSLTLAVLVHFVLFAFWPSRSVAGTERTPDDVVLLAPPADIRIPPPPEKIVRPAEPVPVADVDPARTMAPTNVPWDPPPIETLPPRTQPPEEIVEWVTHLMIHPRLLNREQVARTLERTYPPLLRDAGIAGTVIVHFMIDADGSVLRRELGRSSGHDALDAAALAVAAEMQFAPAYNRGLPVRVWVAVPVVFRTR